MKTPGEIAYEADLKNQPTYYDGTPRKKWEELGKLEQGSWERNPTPRTFHENLAALGYSVKN